ncbi:MAG: glycerol-3-phosphate dehydrogenase [Deltaproteobacteria bacterium]|nr:glycerol-3-phosphate dehydrogenase [Deltaproteobacteria bacterium]
MSDGRRAALGEALARDCFDLLVIGGGINGAGIARDAAMRGLTVALVEQGDFASGTSSKSSKLVHGGLRYLENYEFALVLEASRERDHLRRHLAPHLVHPMPFVFPIFRGDPVGRLRLSAGLWVYDGLSAFRNIARHRSWGHKTTLRHEPALRAEGLRGAMHYYDCWTDDARLTLETIQSATAEGTVACNHVGVTGLLRDGDRLCGARVLDRVSGASFAIAARQIVNATGPWLDRVRRLDDPAAAPVLRLTKGAHIVVPRERLGNRNAIVLRAPRDGRVMFAIPWEDQTLVGTTDTDYEARPEDVAADADDVRYLLEAVNAYFPAARLEERDVIGAYAGLRPLVAPPATEDETPSETSREEEIFESPSGLLSLGGGKLTTYRRVAERVVDRVAERLAEREPGRRFAACRTGEVPLPGARVEDPDRGGFGGFAKRLRARATTGVDEGLVRHLLYRYGIAAMGIVDRLGAAPDAARRVVAGLPYRRIEVTRAAESEMAATIDDVLRRRVPISFRREDGGAEAAADVGRLMADALGWDAEETVRAVERYRTGVADERRRRLHPPAAPVAPATPVASRRRA